MSKRFHNANKFSKAFTLSELIIAVAILGILSAVAVPTFFSQLLSTKQKSCMLTMNNVLTTAMILVSRDEDANSWKDLNDENAVMTINGPAKQNKFSTITVSEDYKLSMAKSGTLYTSECIPIKPSLANYNVRGCNDTQNGALQIKSGDGKTPAQAPICN